MVRRMRYMNFRCTGERGEGGDFIHHEKGYITPIAEKKKRFNNKLYIGIIYVSIPRVYIYISLIT